MQKSDLIRIRHALDAARQAVRFTSGLTAKDLRIDDKTSLATIHAIALVGEALNQVTLPFQIAHPHLPWKEAIGMRNRLIHGYDDIDYNRVIDTVQENLPGLIVSLEGILRTSDLP